MDTLSGLIISSDRDSAKLEAALQKIRLTEKEIALAAILVASHPGVNSKVVARLMASKAKKDDTKNLLPELETALGEAKIYSISNAAGFFEFLATISEDIIKNIFTREWRDLGVLTVVLKAAVSAALAKQFAFDIYLAPVVQENTLTGDELAIWNKLKRHGLNGQELMLSLLTNYREAGIKDIVSSLLNTDSAIYLLLSGASLNQRAQDVTVVLMNILERLLMRPIESSAFVLHQVAVVDHKMVASAAINVYEMDSSFLNNVAVLAHQSASLDMLLQLKNQKFTFELASIADKENLSPFESFLKRGAREGESFILAMMDFLETHTTQEYTQNGSAKLHMAPSLSAVASSLKLLSASTVPKDRVEQVKAVEVQCLQNYPRLINYGQGHDAVVSVSASVNGFSDSVESEMKMYYQKMYAHQMEIREIITMLQRLKQSDVPSEQDVFCCMVHSLFDEYRFFPEYPLTALATTAVLFGSLIHFQLIQGMPLSVALRYVLESVKSPPESNMFKFGLQALFEFRGRLKEFPKYCALLLEVPGLHNHAQLLQQIREGISSAEPEILVSHDVVTTNASPVPAPGGFRSVVPGTLTEAGFQEEPMESVVDRVLFIVNNLAQNNVPTKTKELNAALNQKHYRWFASYIVGQRSRQEPNYHHLYIEMITQLDSQLLESFVLETTYTSILQLLNSPETVGSIDKRTQLKNLGQWLGSFCLARDKPILHKNISFKDLLVEGYVQEKLAAVLPFVCKTLEKTVKSTVFLPPNPWLMGILHVLAELYDFADLKLNLKFEIEVLCNGLGLQHHKLPRSNYVRTRPEGSQTELEGELRSMRLEDEMNATLPPLDPEPVGPVDAPIPFVGGTPFVTHPDLKRLFILAVDKSIQDIFQPVVDRAIGISSVATRELITKDFSLEPDEHRMRVASQNMIRVLASNLALVNSRELIGETLSSNLRNLLVSSGYAEHTVLLDQIPVAISENIDIINSILEKLTLDRASSDVEEQLAPQYHVRAHYRESRSNQVFVDPHAPSKFLLQLPDPFGLKPGGLSQQQMLIYETFGVLKPEDMEDNEALDVGQSAHVIENSILQMQKGIESLEAAVNVTNEPSLQKLSPDHPVVLLMNQLLDMADRSPFREQIVLKTSQITVSSLFTATRTQLGRELFCLFLDRLCEMSAATAKEVVLWLIYSDDERKYDVEVVITLIKAKLITACEIDVSLAKQILERNESAITFASGLIQTAVLGDSPCALRTEFTGCLEVMEALVKSEGNNQCKDLLASLESTQSASIAAMPMQDRMAYIFAEWLRLVQHPSKTERSLHLFVYRLHSKGILANVDYISILIRSSLNQAVGAALRAQGGNQSEAFVAIDALAKLIVTILRTDDTSIKQRVHYAKRIFAVISLVFAKEHDTKLEQFNGRPYFRLFSTILFEMTVCEVSFDSFFQQVYLLIAETFQSLQPMAFPAFSFAWMTLISHRLFLPKLMKIENGKGRQMLMSLLESLLRFVSEYSTGKVFPEMILILYKGLLRLFLVILSDFSAFFIEHHYSLCNAIPLSYVQLRNVVLSAFPENTELPDPLNQELVVEELPQITEPPPMALDPGAELQSFGLKKLVDGYFRNPSTSIVKGLVNGLSLTSAVKYAGIGFDSVSINIPAVHSIVIFIGHKVSQRKSVDKYDLFSRDFPEFQLVIQLLDELSHEGRFILLESMADQLRYPNRHTHFFSCTLLSIFGSTPFGEQKEEVQHVLTRVLLERIICNRPHPWGLMITFTELLRNQSYKFWDLPITKISPEIERMFTSLYDHLSGGTRQLIGA